MSGVRQLPENFWYLSSEPLEKHQMELDELQAAYDVFSVAKVKLENQAGAMARGDSNDGELLVLLLDELKVTQEHFLDVATKMLAEIRDL
jgi:hypothetical protein